VRPIGSINPAEETEEQRTARFVEARNKFIEAHHELVAALDHNSPFIDQKVFEAVHALRSRTTREKIDLQIEQPFTSTWFDRGDTALSDVAMLTYRVSTAIRERVESLVISE